MPYIFQNKFKKEFYQNNNFLRTIIPGDPDLMRSWPHHPPHSNQLATTGSNIQVTVEASLSNLYHLINYLPFIIMQHFHNKI